MLCSVSQQPAAAQQAFPYPPPLPVAGAVALVDVRSREWPLLYANEAFGREEGGGDVEHCTSLGLWDLFEAPAGDGVVSCCCATTAAAELPLGGMACAAGGGEM